MDGEEEVLVRGRTDHIRRQPEPPGEERSFAQKICAADLEGDNSEYHILGQWLWSAELGHLDEGKKVSLMKWWPLGDKAEVPLDVL